eukprot:scaffold86010_cov37-Tisochrysis_lutea.AAC.4
MGGPYEPHARLRKRSCVSGDATISITTCERTPGHTFSKAAHSGLARSDLKRLYSSDLRSNPFHGSYGSSAARYAWMMWWLGGARLWGRGCHLIACGAAIGQPPRIERVHRTRGVSDEMSTGS